MMNTGQSRRRRIGNAKSDMAGRKPYDFVKSAMVQPPNWTRRAALQGKSFASKAGFC
jgi:hypothetical protein